MLSSPFHEFCSYFCFRWGFGSVFKINIVNICAHFQKIVGQIAARVPQKKLRFFSLCHFDTVLVDRYSDFFLFFLFGYLLPTLVGIFSREKLLHEISIMREKFARIRSMRSDDMAFYYRSFSHSKFHKYGEEEVTV